jgi:hypothetical protein
MRNGHKQGVQVLLCIIGACFDVLNSGRYRPQLLTLSWT